MSKLTAFISGVGENPKFIAFMIIFSITIGIAR